MRQAFHVADLLRDGERVVGISGHGVDGQAVEERAEIVVGADGLRSIVATHVEAQSYEAIPRRRASTTAIGQNSPRLASKSTCGPGRYVLTFPTDAGLTCVAAGWRRAEFSRVRTDVEAEFVGPRDGARPGRTCASRASRGAFPWHR